MINKLLQWAKDLSAAFAGAAALLYAFGYLVTRSRSRALGTDPDFSLVDQTYAFAGARFMMITLIAFLITLPMVVLSFHSARWMIPRLPRVIRRIIQILAALFLAFLSLVLLFATLSSYGLLACGGSSQSRLTFLRDAVLGQSYCGLGAVLLGTAVTALTVAWLWHHRQLAGPTDVISLGLTAIVALQILLLPLQVGAFYPDLRARELARVPNGATDLALPLWLIDRGSDRVVLLTFAPGHRFALVNMKSDALDGVATTAGRLDDILQHGDLACSLASSVSD